MWFFLWRQESKERTALYDCEYCTLDQNEWYKNRICFHPKFGEETYQIEVPEFEKTERKITRSNKIVFNKESFLDWLYDFNNDFNPDLSAFKIIYEIIKPRNKKEICVTAFVEYDLGTYIDLEASCNNYHALPYAGGVFDQPIRIMQIFNTIRGVKNSFEDDKIKNIKAKANTGFSIDKKFNKRRR